MNSKFVCNLYMFLWCFYNAQGSFTFSAGFVSTGILAVLLLMSLYAAIIVHSCYKTPVYFKGLGALLLMFTVYGIALIFSSKMLTVREDLDGGTLANYSYLGNVYISLLPIYPCYLFARRGILTKQLLCRWVWVFFMIAMIHYVNTRLIMIEKLSLDEEAETTNNGGYAFLSLIPAMVLFRGKTILQYVGLAICLVFILLSMKRGAILIASCALAYFLWKNYGNASSKERKGIVILTFLVLIGGWILLENMMLNSDYFQYRIQATLEGNTSERDNLYPLFLHHFMYKTTDLQFLFGMGARATLEVGPNFAHNDWLEIAINQGVFGLLVYLGYWIAFYRTAYQKGIDAECHVALVLILGIYFAKTIFSMSYDDMAIYVTSVFGYYLAKIKIDYE